MKRFKPNIFKNSLLILLILSLILIINNLIDSKLNTVNQKNVRIDIGGKFELMNQDGLKIISSDINKIKLYAKNLDAKIITTENDFIKINSNENNDIKFLKIELNILDEKNFIHYLKENI